MKLCTCAACIAADTERGRRRRLRQLKKSKRVLGDMFQARVPATLAGGAP